MTYLYIGLIVAAAAVVLIAFIYYSNKKIKTTRYYFKAPEELKIVQISDLHGAKFGKDNIRLREKIAKLKPDIIVITGDLIHVYSRKNKLTAYRLVHDLAKIAPVYFVSGNHELRNKGYRQFRVGLHKMGAVVLDNKSVKIKGLTLCGLDCASLHNDKIHSVVPNEFGYKILLAHEPQYVKKYAEADVDLALCGHTHGGQWRIPFTKIGVYAPGQGLFPKYCSGGYKVGKTQMIVTQGLGNSEFPLRLFNRPEIVVIELSPQQMIA